MAKIIDFKTRKLLADLPTNPTMREVIALPVTLPGVNNVWIIASGPLQGLDICLRIDQAINPSKVGLMAKCGL